MGDEAHRRVAWLTEPAVMDAAGMAPAVDAYASSTLPRWTIAPVNMVARA